MDGFVVGMIFLCILGYIVIGLFWGFICKNVLDNKGYSFHNGFVWGFFLGFIGLLVCMSRPPAYGYYLEVARRIQSGLNPENATQDKASSNKSISFEPIFRDSMRSFRDSMRSSDSTAQTKWDCPECGTSNSKKLIECTRCGYIRHIR